MAVIGTFAGIRAVIRKKECGIVPQLGDEMQIALPD
jgi:hypothetical protein